MKKICIIRHGETLWSKSGQHTGTTDIELTDNGKNQAKCLGNRLQSTVFNHVFTSPRKRSLDTCHFCNLDKHAVVTKELYEWDYGDYEGKTSAEIHASHPHWNLFLNGAPNGESPENVHKRAKSFLKKIEPLEGTIAIFSHGHFSRALAITFLGLNINLGEIFMLSTASFSILSFKNQSPTLLLWNDTSHLKNQVL